MRWRELSDARKPALRSSIAGAALATLACCVAVAPAADAMSGSAGSTFSQKQQLEQEDSSPEALANREKMQVCMDRLGKETKLSLAVQELDCEKMLGISGSPR